jgi:hypothetical protein
MRPIIEHWERMHKALAVGWKTHNGQSEPLLFGAIGLALDFYSWRTMVRKQGVTDEQAVELMVRIVLCVTRG